MQHKEQLPPTTVPLLWVKKSSRYFPKRDELSFITVLALPKASINGFTCKMRSSKLRFGA